MPQQSLHSPALHNSNASSRTKLYRTSLLDLLPVEICEDILAYLAGSDREAFEQALSETPEEGLRRLQSTIESSPQHFLCCVCVEGHSRIGGCPLPFANRPRESWAPLVPHFKQILFEHVQLHLRRHNFGRKYGSPAPELRELKFYWKDPESVYKYKARAKVIQDHLLLKIECKTKMTRVAAAQSLWDDLGFLPHCGHYDDELRRLCHCALEHTRNVRAGGHFNGRIAGCGTCYPMRRCHRCPSEYKVHVSKFAHIFRLHVTRWVDLGDGKLPLCREWKACVERGPLSSSTSDDVGGVFDLQGLPSVRLRHESRRALKLRRRRAPREEPEPLGKISTEEYIAKQHAHMKKTMKFGRGEGYSGSPPGEFRDGDYMLGAVWPGIMSPTSG